MPTQRDPEIQGRLRADPRVVALVKQQRSGNLTTAQLREFGYDVPDGFHYAFGGRAGLGTLMDNRQSWFESGGPALAIASAYTGGLIGLGLYGASALMGRSAQPRDQGVPEPPSLLGADADSAAAARAAAVKTRKRAVGQGRQSTILTGPLGLGPMSPKRLQTLPLLNTLR